jgi:hypothetical protein
MDMFLARKMDMPSRRCVLSMSAISRNHGDSGDSLAAGCFPGSSVKPTKIAQCSI